MAKVTRALYGRLVERCLRAGGVPRLGACWVMLAIAEMEMRGVSPPPQATWAGNLGISERSLREYLGELRELGLVVSYRVASAPGIAGNAHRLNVPLASQWVGGEIEIGGMISERQNLPEPPADFAGGSDSGAWSERQNLPEAPAAGAGSRVRGNSSSSSAAVNATPSPATPANLTALGDRIRQRLGYEFRIGLPAGVADEVVSRLACGATEEMFERAAKLAVLKATKNRANFMFLVLDDWLANGMPPAALTPGPSPAATGEGSTTSDD